jgi:hypothetical protein
MELKSACLLARKDAPFRNDVMHPRQIFLIYGLEKEIAIFDD